MKLILFTFVIVQSFMSFADIAPSPQMIASQKNLKAYQKLSCKDKKNLVICHFSEISNDANECAPYADKPTEFKKLGRNTLNSFGEEKYCHLQGRDRISRQQK